MINPKPLHVAALVDLPRSASAGGHVKCWERLAAAAANSSLPLNLTVYFSGPEQTEILGPHARLRQLPPVFSTSKLKFLPYVPDHTDLAPYHWRLARELSAFDAIHTTDGFFAFARTAEHVSRRFNIPLVTSFHTDTPSYTRIFTRQTIERLFGTNWLGQKLLHDWRWPERQANRMEERLKQHVRCCQYAIVTRAEDHALAENILGQQNVQHLRLGVDRALFDPGRRDRSGIEHDYNIPTNSIVLLFVGRLDVGKNIYTLIEVMEKLIAEGLSVHLIAAGLGPAADDVKKRLGTHSSVPGFVQPSELARLYASVDGLALTSEVEIRSMAGVEALTSGCPVLVSEKSGVAQLFGYTPAMRTVTSGVEPWANALRDFAINTEQRMQMRDIASEYGRTKLASWHDVLAEDLFAVWQKAVANKTSQTSTAA